MDKTILVGIDLAEPYARLLEQGEELALLLNAKLRLVYVAPPDPSFLGSASWPQEVRDGFASELKDNHTHLVQLAKEMQGRGVDCDSVMTRGSVVDILLEQIEKATPVMTIVGSQREGGLLSGLAGGVVRGMLRRSMYPVLVVPLPEKVRDESF
jgi:nucleotide-binding universal stress UspA family protein